MNEIPEQKSVAIKTLAIIGFFVTLAILAWLAVEGIKRAPATFTSLASIAKTLETYKPINEISIATEKSVVNSSESFQITWTDVKQEGEYHFSYTCTEGVDLEVRSSDGKLVPVACTDMLTLPATVHGLFLSLTSDVMRFTEVPIKVTFTNEQKGVAIESKSNVTVVNATIPTKEDTQVVVKTPEEKPVVTKPVEVKKPEVIAPKPKPVVPQTPTYTPTVVYPQSNPNGIVDLKMTTLGNGTFKNGVFSFTPTYDLKSKNGIRFDVKNIGTKTSGTWTFKTTLPNGEVFTSDTQTALKPQEHVEFTLGFDLESNTKSLVKITNTVYTKEDTNEKNNSSVSSVAVTK